MAEPPRILKRFISGLFVRLVRLLLSDEFPAAGENWPAISENCEKKTLAVKRGAIRKKKKGGGKGGGYIEAVGFVEVSALEAVARKCLLPEGPTG